MFEVGVSFMANGTLHDTFVTQVHRMLEKTIFGSNRSAAKRLVEGHVTNAAVVANDLSVLAKVLSVVAAKTSLNIVMADIVHARLPIRLHFRKK
jgi:hypothetical protein